MCFILSLCRKLENAVFPLIFFGSNIIDLFLVTLLILLHGQENEFAKCPVADSSAVADLSAVALHLQPECASQAKPAPALVS